MTDLEHQHDDTLFFDAADDAVVFYAVAPEASQVVPERLAESSWIFVCGDSLAKIAQESLLRFAVEFSQLAAGAIVEFNSPNWCGRRVGIWPTS